LIIWSPIITKQIFKVKISNQILTLFQSCYIFSGPSVLLIPARLGVENWVVNSNFKQCLDIITVLVICKFSYRFDVGIIHNCLHYYGDRMCGVFVKPCHHKIYWNLRKHKNIITSTFQFRQWTCSFKPSLQLIYEWHLIIDNKEMAVLYQFNNLTLQYVFIFIIQRQITLDIFSRFSS
jgi:hypothetical protein